MLRIHCANCKGSGKIDHPAEMVCPFCNGYGSKEIFYNFIRKHQAIGVCPYELATDIKLDNPNKWMGLIELSKNIF